MDDIGEYVRQAVEKFTKSQVGTQYRIDVTPAAAENLLRCAYYASMIPDEGRWPRTTIMCYGEGSTFGTHIVFERNSHDVTVDEIAKLAHASGQDWHICCIAKDRDLKISGLHITRIGERPDLGYSTHRIANPLKVRILGPGHIDMSTGGIVLVYKAGKIGKETLLLHSPILEKLAARVTEEMKKHAAGKVESVEDIIHDVAKGMIRQGHGGLLLFAAEQKRSYFSSCRGIQSILLEQAMYEYWKCVEKLLESVGGRSGLPRKPEEAKNALSLVMAYKTETLEKCVQAVAHLSGLDGAIAMNFECKVVAFNAIIGKADIETKNYCFVDYDGKDFGGYKEVIAGRGSRHQSALTFVMKVPESFALVVSQDGFVTAFHHHEEKRIVCDRELRVME